MPFAEGKTLAEALEGLAARMPGAAESITVTGVRRDGTWKVQGSVPVQRGVCRCPWNTPHAADCPSWVPGRIG